MHIPTHAQVKAAKKQALKQELPGAQERAKWAGVQGYQSPQAGKGHCWSLHAHPLGR
jgi:hypothetical protein